MALLVKSNSVGDAFEQIIGELCKSPDVKSSPRGLETRELLNVLVEISNPYNRLVNNTVRNISLKYLVGEWLWYERGSNSLREISYYSSFWNSITDDGLTANSAYGFRIFGLHQSVGKNQWQQIKNILRIDKDSRRAVITIFLPSDTKHETKDQPCTLTLHFLIRKNSLNLTVNMRSNDIILGFPYDCACFTLFQEKMLLELREFYPNLRMGRYYHFVSSLHIYRKHYGIMRDILRSRSLKKTTRMPRMNNLSEIKKLQYNEEVIRSNSRKAIRKLTDSFCIWCQNKLMK